jgi:hypothetical protein
MARTFKTQPIGQCFLYEVAHRDGSYFTESDHLPRGKDLFLADAVAGAQQQDDLLAVWQLNPAEGGMRDISEDVARAMLAESDTAEVEDLSDFVRAHLTDGELDEHFAALAGQRAHERELASPEAMGRI